MTEKTWELVPTARQPVVGELRYLRREKPCPSEPLDEIYPAIWDGEASIATGVRKGWRIGITWPARLSSWPHG